MMAENIFFSSTASLGNSASNVKRSIPDQAEDKRSKFIFLAAIGLRLARSIPKPPGEDVLDHGGHVETHHPFRRNCIRAFHVVVQVHGEVPRSIVDNEGLSYREMQGNRPVVRFMVVGHDRRAPDIPAVARQDDAKELYGGQADIGLARGPAQKRKLGTRSAVTGNVPLVISKDTENGFLADAAKLETGTQGPLSAAQFLLRSRGKERRESKAPEEAIFKGCTILHVQRHIPQTALVVQSPAVRIEDRLIDDYRYPGTNPDRFSVFQGEGKRGLEKHHVHVLIVRARQVSVEAEELVLKLQARKRRVRIGQLLGDFIFCRGAALVCESQVPPNEKSDCAD